MAAILLAKSENQADRKMLLDLAQVRQRSWGVWMAIADAGNIDLPRAAIASPVYKDQQASIAVRVAAAAALEPLDSQAASFVVSQVQSFLARFAEEGAGQMLGGLAQAKPADDARKRFADFRFSFHTLGSLLVLKNNAAQQITLQYLTARNESIRDLCGIVAAIRWPDQLLKAGQGSFSDQEYADLLAVVALKHPDQATAAAIRITPDRMAVAKAHIDKVGLGVFGLPGNILKVF